MEGGRFRHRAQRESDLKTEEDAKRAAGMAVIA
jgi:hypothetical protein